MMGGFIDCHSRDRPHQALGMRCPAELSSGSMRPYRRLDELRYPYYDRTIAVTRCGRLRLGTRRINLSTVFARQNVGIKQVSDRIWIVTFMQYDFGFFDD